VALLPRAHAEHDRHDVEQHASEPDESGDTRVELEQAQSAEHVCPVVFTTANERQHLTARVGRVHGHIPETLSHPPERDARGVAIAAAPEVGDEHCGHDELAECATGHANELAEWAEHEMSRLMNGEVHAVEQPSRTGMQQTRNAVE